MLKDNDYYEAGIGDNASMSDYSIENLVARLRAAGHDVSKLRICKVCHIDITCAVNVSINGEEAAQQ